MKVRITIQMFIGQDFTPRQVMDSIVLFAANVITKYRSIPRIAREVELQFSASDMSDIDGTDRALCFRGCFECWPRLGTG